MSQVEILRHAIDAARAGNPELARVHLQKAAEIVPDDPAVWLWLSWLSDSPVSMIQCLELVRRHDDYQEIAEAGLAFARGLARFDCDALLPEVPVESPSEYRTAENVSASEDARSVEEREELPTENAPIADETIAEAESGDPVFEAETTSEAEEPTPNETGPLADSLSEVEFEEPAAQSDDAQETPEGEPLTEQPAIESTESEEAAALDSLDDIDEEFEAAASSLWDGIALLSRTADAVADELKADSEFHAEETDSEETALSQLDPSHTDPDASPLDVQDKTGLDSEASEEGNSWFDYWLPEDKRAAGSTSHEETVADQTTEQSTTSPEADLDEVAETNATPQQDSPVSGDTVALEEDVHDESPNPAVTDEPAEVSGNTSSGDDEEKPAVLEIVDGNPFEASLTSDEESKEPNAEADSCDSTDAESDAKVTSGYVPPVAQTVFDIPVALQGDAKALPQAPDSEEEIAEEESIGWSAPTPTHQPDDVWRAAQSDWFSVGHQQNPEALIPHENPSSEPTATSSELPVPGAFPQQASSPTTPGPEIRTANQSIFDAEPTPPAVIPNQPALDADSQAHPETRLARVENVSGEGNDEATETSLGRPLADEQSQTESTQNETQQNTPRPQARIKSGDARTVLVVDDSPTVRKLVEMSLERNGFRVVHAFDGVAAIKEIARQNPSLILMDVNMPRLDGYQLCKLVKKHETTRHIPVVMLTSKEGVFDKLKGRLVGCSGYIAKPFSPEELVAAVEQFLAEPATL